MCEYEFIKGYHVDNDEMEKETIRHLRGIWNSRQRYERIWIGVIVTVTMLMMKIKR